MPHDELTNTLSPDYENRNYSATRHLPYTLPII